MSQDQYSHPVRIPEWVKFFSAFVVSLVIAAVAYGVIRSDVDHNTASIERNRIRAELTDSKIAEALLANARNDAMLSAMQKNLEKRVDRMDSQR